MIQALFALLLLPFALLFGAAGLALVWDQVVAGWHSGFAPVALASVVFGWALLLIPGRGQKLRRKPGDPR